MTIPVLTMLLGWMTLINIGILLISTFSVVMMRGAITAIHSQLFDIDEQDLGRAYFQYLAQFKIAIIVFNLTPYIALKIMA